MKRLMLISDYPMNVPVIINLIEKNKIRVICDKKLSSEFIAELEEYLPDAIIFDTDLGTGVSLKLIELMRQSSNLTPVIVFGDNSDKECVRKSFDIGVNGYLSRQSKEECLIFALHGVLTGYKIFPLTNRA